MCPSCYYRNGLNRLHCENCGTRLIGSAPLDIEGPEGSRQTVGSPADHAAEDEWLLSGQGVDVEDEKQVTDWLTQIRDSKPFGPLDTEPINPFTQEEMEQEEALDLPDWLNDTAVSPPPPSAPKQAAQPQTGKAEAPAAKDSLPEWLGATVSNNDDLGLDRTSFFGSEDDVNWLDLLGAEPALEEEPEPDKPSSTPASPATSQADDWLNDKPFDFDTAVTDSDDHDDDKPTSTGFTKWLKPETVDEFEAQQDSLTDDLFATDDDDDDFLSEFGLDELDELDDDSPSTGFTSWLDNTKTDASPAPESAPKDNAEDEESEEGEEDVPDWLKPSAAAPPASLSNNPSLTNWLEADDSQTETAEDLPDWLRDPTPSSTDADTAVGTGFTAWLSEEAPPETPPSSPAIPDPDSAPEKDLPDWLQEPTSAIPDPAPIIPTGFTGMFSASDSEATDEPAIADQEDDDEAIPDWLKETGDEETEEISTGFTNFLTEQNASGDESLDLPDWLQEKSDEEEEDTDAVSMGFTSWLTTPQTPAPDGDDRHKNEDEDADLPDWLRPDPSTTATPSLSGDAPDEEGTGFTDWLLESEGESGAEATDALFDDDDAIAEMDLTPLSVEEAAQFLADMPEVSEDFIADSVEEDFPDWLVDVETIEPDTATLKLPAWMQEPVSSTDELELGFSPAADVVKDTPDFETGEPADTVSDDDWLSGLGVASTASDPAGLSWLDKEDNLGAQAADTGEDKEDDEEEDWLEDIEQLGRSALPQTDWLGRISAEADEASNRMSWLDTDDGKTDANVPDDSTQSMDAATRPQTDDLAEREMPAWLAADPADDLGIELASFDDAKTIDADSAWDLFGTPDTAVDSANWLSEFPSTDDDSDDATELTSDEGGLPSNLDWLSDMPTTDQDDDNKEDWLSDFKDSGGPGRPAVTSQLAWFDFDDESDSVAEQAEREQPQAESAAETVETTPAETAEPAFFDAALDFDAVLESFEEETADGEEGEGLDWLAALEETIPEPEETTAVVSSELAPEAELDADDYEADDALWLASDTAVGTGPLDQETEDIFAMLSESGDLADTLRDQQEFEPDDWLLASAEAQISDESWDDWQDEFDDALTAEGDIPAWIDDFDDLEDEEEEETVQVGGPLDGLKGIIAVAPIVAEPITRVNPLQASTLSVTAAQKEQVNLWHAIAQSEFKPASQGQTIPLNIAPEAPSLTRVWQLVLSLLLIAAVLLGLLWPGLANLLGVAPAAPSVGVTAVHDTLASASGQPVLVAFEYPPALAGELDETAVLLLSELAANDSTAIIMSQHPAGMANAERLLTSVPELATLDVVRLGYVPGEGVGLRELGACLTQANCQTIFGSNLTTAVPLADTAVFIVLTSEQDNLINWLEQIGQPMAQPLLLGVTESLAPLARPYVQAGQVAGLMAGLPDAASYAAAYEPTADNTAVFLLNARTLAQMVAIAILILGLLLGLMPRRAPSASSPASVSAASEAEAETEDKIEIV